jgi:pyruvate/2-oxoglutarate dehydrogenase complex dihydrolipoamide dehydrogenase (E3) component
MADTYDVIVLGAGPTGENVADRAVKGGLTALIVESELVGGECSYWACMPSKALLRPVGAADEAHHLRGVTGARLVVDEVLGRRDSFTHDWKDDSQVDWLSSAHIDLARGKGRIAGVRAVEVDGTRYAARHAVAVCTGTRAAVPPMLADVGAWTSREATSAGEPGRPVGAGWPGTQVKAGVPERLAIVGGGVVGCEMAAAWSALGVRVTLIARGGLLERAEDFAGELVADGLRAAGVDVRTGVSAVSASRGTEVTLTLSDGTQVSADEVLAATGRAPRTDDIGLEHAGLRPGTWLDTDDTLMVQGVDGDWLYAAGDVNHRALLTHMGKYQARVCGDAIAARARGAEPQVRATAPVPQVIFTLPEVASVGLTAAEAIAAGYRTRVVDYDLGSVAGASLFADDYSGRARMVVDEDRRVLLGVTFAGPGTGEMIHSATIAVAGAVPLDDLWQAVPSYPTMSEVWLRLLETYGM